MVGEYLTTRNRLAKMLMDQEKAAAPIQSHTQGLASMLRSGLAGYLTASDARQRREAQNAMMQGLMGQRTKGSYLGGVDQAGDPAPAGVPGALVHLQGLGDNEYAANNIERLAMMDYARKQQLADQNVAFERQKELYGMKETAAEKRAREAQQQRLDFFQAGQQAQDRRAQEARQFIVDTEARKSDAAAAKKAAENSQTLKMFNVAMNNLEASMSATETGPIAGMVPAFTAEQQTAEGAVAAMAPILKGLFRTAGEGTFTDKDQELLLKMVPTRTDTPESRQAKINNIRSIVDAKLGGKNNPDITNPGQPPIIPPDSTSIGLTVDEQAELEALRKRFGR